MSVVSVLKESIRLAGRARQTVCVWGHRGIGKSEIMAQLARQGDGETIHVYKAGAAAGIPTESGESDGDETIEIPLPIGLVDYRCSQIEAPDIRGLPDKLDGRTVYLPPLELPTGDRSSASILRELVQINDPVKRKMRKEELQPRYKCGYLFLDEINRAQDDVLQAIFQLLLDLRIGQYILPPGWRIVIACNYMEGDYITNGFNDAALLDRMCHLQFVAGDGTLEDWTRYMANKHGQSCGSIIEFCASNVDYMTGKIEGNLGFTVKPSPRSWDRVAKIEQIAEEGGFSEDARFNVIQGMVGQGAAIAYREYSCPVKPGDILDDGVKRFKNKLLEMTRSQIASVCWGLVAATRGRTDEESVVDTCLDFAEIMLESNKVNDKDIIIGFCRALLDDGEDDLTSCLTNRDLTEIILEHSSDAPLLLKKLYKREQLHGKFSITGWGDV
jgi:hypothetical protein